MRVMHLGVCQDHIPRKRGERDHDNPTTIVIELDVDGYIRGSHEWHKEYHRRYYHLKRGAQDATRKSIFKQKYGLTLEEAEAMYVAADGKCECCGTPVARHGTGAGKQHTANIDHCHTTNKIRGILCNRCNQALGLLNDRPALAVAYLEKTNARA